MTPAKKKPAVEPDEGPLDDVLGATDAPADVPPVADDPAPDEPAEPETVVLDREEHSVEELHAIAHAAVLCAHRRGAGGRIHVAVALSQGEDGEWLPMMVDNAENLQLGLERARDLVVLADAEVAVAAMLDGSGAARAHVVGVYEGITHQYDWQEWSAEADTPDR